MMSSTTPNQTFHQPHATTSTTTPGSSLIDLFTYQFDQLEASIIDSQRYFNQKISDQLQKQQNADDLEKQNDLLRRDVEFYSELLTTTNNQLNESTAKIAVLQQMVQNKTQHISTLQQNLQQSQQVQTELKQSIINSQQAQTELKKSIINITSQYSKKEEHYQHQITQLSNSTLQVHMLEQQIQTYKKLNDQLQMEANNLKADLAKVVGDYKTECATLTKANVLLQDQCNNQRQQLQDYVKAHQHGEKEKYNNQQANANNVQTKIIEEQRKQISHLRLLCQDLTKQLQQHQHTQSSSAQSAVSMPNVQQKSPIATKLQNNKMTTHPPIVDEGSKMHSRPASKKKAVGLSSHISKGMNDDPFQSEEEKPGQIQKKKKSHKQTDSKNVIKLQSTFGGSDDDDDGHFVTTSTTHVNSSGQQQQHPHDVENHDANSHHKNDKKRKTSSTIRKKSRTQSDVSDRSNHNDHFEVVDDNDDDSNDDNDYGDKADVLAHLEKYALDQDDLQDPFLNLHVGHINKKSKMNWDE